VATERLKTIKSSGGDYTSLSAAEAGEDDLGDLVSRDEWMHFSCYAMEDTTAVTIDGWTTDSTRYILIDTPTSDRHGGKWSTNKYRIVYSSRYNAVINIKEQYVDIYGLQISGRIGIAFDGGTDKYVSSIGCCIIKGENVDSDYEIGVLLQPSGFSADSVIKIFNCIIYDFGGTTYNRSYSCGIRNAIDSSNLSLHVYNCTIHNCSIGIRKSIGDYGYFKNVLTQSCYDGFYTSWNWELGEYSNNLSDISDDAPGTNSRSSQDVTFVDESGDDFHLASTDAGALNYGVSDPGSGLFSDDIDGETRSGTWDIGADEYVASGASIPLSNPFSRPFRQSFGRGGF
jgi:hypothetical protein